MGARADHWPSETKTITPYVAEQFPQGFNDPSCEVKVLSAERTFWEKATILHAEFHRPAEKPMPERFSRHYCDFYELIRKGVAKVGDGKAGIAGASGGAQKSLLQIELGRGMAKPRRVAAYRATGASGEGVAGGLCQDAANVLWRTAGVRQHHRAVCKQWEREFNQE